MKRIKLEINSTNEWQYNMAAAISGVLCSAGLHPVLAGGAPRSWYLGQEANDLDFFCYGACTAERIQHTKDMLTALFDDVKFTTLGDPKKYKEAQSVVEFTAKGQVVQMMFDMPSITEWKYEMSKVQIGDFVRRDAYATKEFVDGFKNKEFLGDKEDPYIQKFMRRFPDIRIVSPAEAELYIHLDNVLDDEESSTKPAQRGEGMGWLVMDENFERVRQGFLDALRNA